MHPFDMAGHQRSGVNDGDARAFAQRARLKEQQQVEAHLGLTLYETVVGDDMWELPPHVLAYIA
jgi:hypothetical protein